MLLRSEDLGCIYSGGGGGAAPTAVAGHALAAGHNNALLILIKKLILNSKIAYYNENLNTCIAVVHFLRRPLTAATSMKLT